MNNNVLRETYSGEMRLRLSRLTHRKVAEMANIEGVSMNSFLNHAIEVYIGQRELMNEKVARGNKFIEASNGR